MIRLSITGVNQKLVNFTADGQACDFLEKWGYRIVRNGHVIPPRPRHVERPEEKAAIDYLCSEWDYSFETNPVSPEEITQLQPDEVFVFGSNTAGRHGKGAAKQAVKFGAIRGQGEGLMGQSYGIPTKDDNLRVLPLRRIQYAVDRFIQFTILRDKYFLVTPIGCGLAGYSAKDIAPMFRTLLKAPNVALPLSFRLSLE